MYTFKCSGACIACASIYMTWMSVCVCNTMAVPGSVLLLCVLRAAKEFMLFRPSSLPRLPAILGKSKLQSFSVWLACVVPNLYLTYPSCSVPRPPPFFTSPISLPLHLPRSNGINLCEVFGIPGFFYFHFS